MDRIEETLQTAGRSAMSPARRGMTSVIKTQLEALRQEFDDDFARAPHEDLREVRQCLLLTLAGESYAYPLEYVLELLAVPPIIPVPNLPQAVLGIINFRGQILSVTTIHGLLGLAVGEPGSGSRILVTTGLPLFTGILVDGVECIVDVAADDVQPLPDTIGSEKAQLLAGQFYLGNQIVFLLDMAEACGSELLQINRNQSFKTSGRHELPKSGRTSG